MTDEQIADMIADREAGTPGPWRVKVNSRDDQVTCDLTICGDIFQLADLNGPQYAHQHPNARRISRVPDMEATIIAQAAELATMRAERDALREAGTHCGISQGSIDILIERQRQIDKEGWTPEHDDEHAGGQMALAAGCYAMFASASDRQRATADLPGSLASLGKTITGWAAWLQIWPWDRSWWKPTDRRDLVKAGALIIAEIERLDRLTPKGGA